MPRSTEVNLHDRPRVALYGWRKRCLYCIVLVLVALVLVNMALTLWILQVLDFTVHGMGKVRLRNGEISIHSDVEFLETVKTTKIEGLKNFPLHLFAHNNLTIKAEKNKDKSQLTIGNQNVEIVANEFIIRSTSGQVLFTTKGQQVSLGTGKLVLNGPHGVTVKKAVDTPVLRSKRNLLLESTSGGLFLSAFSDLQAIVKNGPMNIESPYSVLLKAASSLEFISRNITLPNLPLGHSATSNAEFPLVYQLCVCGNNGRLFLSQAEGTCRAQKKVCS